MPAITHVVRRGAVYHWRRRLPSRLGESKGCANLVLGLRTRDPVRARFLANQVTALADLFLADAETMRMTPQQTKDLFAVVFAGHLDKLEAVAARERREPTFDIEAELGADLTMGWVYRLLETRGANAVVDVRARAQMQAAGLDAGLVDDVEAGLDLLRRNRMVPDRRERLEALVRAQGGEPSPMNLALAQSLVFRAISTACFQVSRRHDGIRVEDEVAIRNILEAEARRPVARTTEPRERIEADAARLEEVTQTSPPEALEAVVDEHSSKRTQPALREAEIAPAPISLDEHFVVEIGDRVVTSQGDSWDERTARQAKQTYRLFARLMLEKGIVAPNQLSQEHFGSFVDLLQGLAKSYGKSSADRERSTKDLLAVSAKQPKERRGLSPETIARHLSFLTQWLRFVKGRGERLGEEVDLSLLRSRSNTRERNKRGFLQEPELLKIFNLPAFTGCEGWDKKKVLVKGSNVYHRALYFAPILLHYTLARREEICGLLLDDVIAGPVPALWIRDNEQRKIKSLASERILPLHPEVLRLGFLEYVEELRRLGYKLCFPDLKSSTSEAPLGERFYREFMPGFEIAVPDREQHRKVIHSLRKSGGSKLKKAGIPAENRADVLGHAGSNVTEEVYAEASALKTKLEELCKLPVVTEHLERSPIKLLPWVAAKLPAPFTGKVRSRSVRQRRLPRSKK